MTFDLLLKNFNVGYNFQTSRDGAFKVNMCIPCDRTTLMVPLLLHIGLGVPLGGMSSSRCFFDIADIAMKMISCQHRYLSYLIYIEGIAMLSILCQHRYPVIVCLSCLVYIVHIVDFAMLTISYRYSVDDTLSYLVDIAMLTISCRYCVYIGTLSFLVYIVHIVDIAMLTILCRYRVSIDILSYRIYTVYILNMVMLTISCRHRYPVIPRLHRSHRRHRDVDDIV